MIMKGFQNLHTRKREITIFPHKNSSQILSSLRFLSFLAVQPKYIFRVIKYVDVSLFLLSKNNFLRSLRIFEIIMIFLRYEI